MSSHEHFGRLARQLTPPRRAVLEALAECGPMTTQQIADCWQERDPDLTPLVARSLPKFVVDSVWRLENLGAVSVEDSTVAITDVGRRQLGCAVAHRPRRLDTVRSWKHGLARRQQPSR